MRIHQADDDSALTMKYGGTRTVRVSKPAAMSTLIRPPFQTPSTGSSSTFFPFIPFLFVVDHPIPPITCKLAFLICTSVGHANSLTCNRQSPANFERLVLRGIDADTRWNRDPVRKGDWKALYEIHKMYPEMGQCGVLQYIFCMTSKKTRCSYM